MRPVGFYDGDDARIVAYYSDIGSSWTTVMKDPHQPNHNGQVQGSVVSDPERKTLYFAHPNSPTEARTHMTLFRSPDDSLSWDAV